jgi:hypothetical protein
MDLNELHKALNSSRVEFDKWVFDHQETMSNYFYWTTGKDFVSHNFDSFYFNEIRGSLVYKEFHRAKNFSEPFDIFLTMLGIAAEKMAEVGSDAFALAIVIDLPESPSKYRLKAINEFAVVADVRVDYVNKFPTVLDLLDQSRIKFEEGTVRPIVDVLAFYYNKAKASLKEFGLAKKISEVEDLYSDEDTRAKYPFLGHELLNDIIAGKDPFKLYVIPVVRGCLTPSDEIRTLFSQFNSDYRDHPSINDYTDNLWGLTRKEILDEVLVRGRGDFTISYRNITTDDKVMLYCYFNLKKHFFTSYAVFQNVVDSLGNFFKDPEYKPVFIDLGCGPMTSGLAIADLIDQSLGFGINFSYIGVDIADAMINRAKTFRTLKIFSEECYFDFKHNWNEISAEQLYSLAGKHNPIIFNASYLLASDSVDEKDLAKYIGQVGQHYSNVYFVFQNPNRVDRNLKYETLKSLIDKEEVVSRIENVRYRSVNKEANEDVAYEILKLKKS